MTARELLPGVYKALIEAAYDMSESTTLIHDLDHGISDWKSPARAKGQKTLAVQRVKRRKEQVKHDVSRELEAAGRPDLVEPFQRFIDRYMTNRHASRLIEALFNTER